MRKGLKSGWGIIFASSLFIFSFYIRTVGISLYIALFFYLLLKKEYTYLPVTVLFGFAVLLWFAYVFSYSGGYDKVFMLKDVYNPLAGTITFKELLLRVISNLKYYSGKVVADLLFYPYFKEVTFGNVLFPLKIALSLLFSFIFLYGFYKATVRNLGIVELYIFIYFTILLFWPYHDERFLLPIYPFLLGYAAYVLRGKRILTYGLVLLLVAPVILSDLKAVKNLLRRNNQQESPQAETLLWIKQNTLPSAVISSTDPAGIYYYTQRKGILWSQKENASDALLEIKETGVTHIVLEKDAGLTVRGKKEKPAENYLNLLSHSCPECLILVYRSAAKPEIDVYAIDRQTVPGHK
jgi:hypothetical protein